MFFDSNFNYFSSQLLKQQYNEQQMNQINQILYSKKEILSQCIQMDEFFIAHIFIKNYQTVFHQFVSVLKIAMQFYIKSGLEFPQDNYQRNQLRKNLNQLIISFIKNESQSLIDTTKEIFKKINVIVFMPIEQILNSIANQQGKIKEFKESTIRQKSWIMNKENITESQELLNQLDIVLEMSHTNFFGEINKEKVLIDIQSLLEVFMAMPVNKIRYQPNEIKFEQFIELSNMYLTVCQLLIASPELKGELILQKNVDAFIWEICCHVETMASNFTQIVINKQTLLIFLQLIYSYCKMIIILTKLVIDLKQNLSSLYNTINSLERHFCGQIHFLRNCIQQCLNINNQLTNHYYVRIIKLFHIGSNICFQDYKCLQENIQLLIFGYLEQIFKSDLKTNLKFKTANKIEPFIQQISQQKIVEIFQEHFVVWSQEKGPKKTFQCSLDAIKFLNKIHYQNQMISFDCNCCQKIYNLFNQQQNDSKVPQQNFFEKLSILKHNMKDLIEIFINKINNATTDQRQRMVQNVQGMKESDFKFYLNLLLTINLDKSLIILKEINVSSLQHYQTLLTLSQILFSKQFDHPDHIQINIQQTILNVLKQLLKLQSENTSLNLNQVLQTQKVSTFFILQLKLKKRQISFPLFSKDFCYLHHKLSYLLTINNQQFIQQNLIHICSTCLKPIQFKQFVSLDKVHFQNIEFKSKKDKTFDFNIYENVQTWSQNILQTLNKIINN